MKILHVEAGRHLYGGARQVLDLMEALAARGFDNVLVCAHGSEIARAAANVAEVQAIRWRGDIDVAAALRLRQLVRRSQPQLVHAHSRRGADWFTALAAGAVAIPAVVSRRVDNPESGAMVRWKYRRYRAVVAISSAIARMLAEQAGVPPDKLHTIRDAVDTARFRPTGDRQWLAQEFALDPARPVAAMLAQFIPRKGHRLLLEALDMVYRHHPGLQVLLFGRGALRDRIAGEIAARGWNARIRLPGFRSDMDRVLPALDMVVHPALTEGLGVALLEASACGVPIVATTAGGIPEVVLDGVSGLLVPPGDTPALARAVSRLLESPELARQLGAAARRRAVAHFSIAAMGDRHATLYRQLITGAK